MTLLHEIVAPLSRDIIGDEVFDLLPQFTALLFPSQPASPLPCQPVSPCIEASDSHSKVSITPVSLETALLGSASSSPAAAHSPDAPRILFSSDDPEGSPVSQITFADMPPLDLSHVSTFVEV